MIDCQFRKIPKYTCLKECEINTTLKEGRYHNSHFNLEEKDRRVIGAYIEFDYLKWLGTKLTEQEIIQQCLEFLNVLVEPKKNKKGKAKKPYYKYGFLKNYSSKIVKDKDNHFYILALLTTNDSDNKHFWNDDKKARKEDSDLGISSLRRRKKNNA